MKKFITVVPMQRGETLLYKTYTATNNSRLEMNEKTHFPIVPVINGYIEEDEPFYVFALMEKDNDACRENYDLLCKEVEMVAKSRQTGFQIVQIDISKEESIDEHLKTLSRLIDIIRDNDQIYACITFGTKPTVIIELTAFSIANKLKENVCIECIAYGKVNRKYNPETGGYNIDSVYINDLTSLFYLSSVAENLNRLNAKNPMEIIRNILDF